MFIGSIVFKKRKFIFLYSERVVVYTPSFYTTPVYNPTYPTSDRHKCMSCMHSLVYTDKTRCTKCNLEISTQIQPKSCNQPTLQTLANLSILHCCKPSNLANLSTLQTYQKWQTFHLGKSYILSHLSTLQTFQPCKPCKPFHLTNLLTLQTLQKCKTSNLSFFRTFHSFKPSIIANLSFFPNFHLANFLR